MSIENKTNINADERIDDASKAEHMAYAEAPYRGELSRDGIVYRKSIRVQRDIERGLYAAERAGDNYDITLEAERATD